MHPPPDNEKKHPGHMIQLALGKHGGEYALVTPTSLSASKCGSRPKQEMTYTGDGVPRDLCQQLLNLERSNTIQHVSFGPSGEWFLHYSSTKPNGDDQAFWDVPTTLASDFLTERFTESEAKTAFCVAFGPSLSFCLVDGRGGVLFSKGPKANVPPALRKRITNVMELGGRIFALSLFSNGGYFIIDSEGGLDIYGAPLALERSLRRGGYHDVCSVQLTPDAEWIILRYETFQSSKGICDTLREKLQAFYDLAQTHRQELQEFALQEERIAKEKAKLLRQQEKIRLKVIESKKNLVQRMSKARRKGLKVGQVVTVAGFSNEPGDCMIDSVDDECRFRVGRRVDGRDGMEVMEDMRKIAVYRRDDEMPSEVIKLVQATDKYSASVVGLKCHRCNSSICFCNRDWLIQSASFSNLLQLTSATSLLSGTTLATTIMDDSANLSESHRSELSPMSNPSNHSSSRIPNEDNHVLDEHSEKLCNMDHVGHETVMRLLQRTDNNELDKSNRVEFAPILESEKGEELMFDEYMCAEKIDFGNLEKLRKHLEIDRLIRREMMESLLIRKANHPDQETKLGAAFLKKLKRCHELELVIAELYEIMKDYPQSTDTKCVTHLVEYQQRDDFHRGRMFALGKHVAPFENRYPRNTTLQSMHSDWLAPLCGAFGHYIEVDNSQIRILCSIAAQLGLSSLLPTMIDFRDHNSRWIKTISALHDITEEAARKWPNIIIAGGLTVYRSWLENAGITENDQDPVIRLAVEVAILSEEILIHPKYRWACADRIKLVSEGRSPANIQAIMLNRVIQSCENEILSINQRCFQSLGWTTRSKIFDSLIVERRPDSTSTLQATITLCETSCRIQGWKIRLVERDMHGLHDAPVKTIVDARLALVELSKAQKRNMRKQFQESEQRNQKV